ncbi:MAG: replication initiation protein [Nitrospirae bacterium]|nr:replication initiation protein [Nitrospirota bacterium]
MDRDKQNNMDGLHSAYSTRLYELLKQHEKAGIITLKIEELRKVFGIEDSKYKFYKDFKRRVILTAQAELAKNADISVEFKEIKSGSKVTDIEFTIVANQLTEDKTPATKQTTPQNIKEHNGTARDAEREDKEDRTEQTEHRRFKTAREAYEERLARKGNQEKTDRTDDKGVRTEQTDVTKQEDTKKEKKTEDKDSRMTLQEALEAGRRLVLGSETEKTEDKEIPPVIKEIIEPTHKLQNHYVPKASMR